MSFWGQSNLRTGQCFSSSGFSVTTKIISAVWVKTKIFEYLFCIILSKNCRWIVAHLEYVALTSTRVSAQYLPMQYKWNDIITLVDLFLAEKYCIILEIYTEIHLCTHSYLIPGRHIDKASQGRIHCSERSSSKRVLRCPTVLKFIIYFCAWGIIQTTKNPDHCQFESRVKHIRMLLVQMFSASESQSGIVVFHEYYNQLHASIF